jgi:hypothetical protein
MKMEQNVLKRYPEESIQNSDAGELPRRKHTKFRRRGLSTRKHTKFRRWGIIQKKAFKIQTPGNYPEESIQNSDAGELPRRKYIKFRCRGITQKKEHNVQNRRKFEFKKNKERTK